MKEKSIWTFVIMALMTALSTLIWTGGTLLQAATPPVPNSSIIKMERQRVTLDKLRLLPAIAQLELSKLSGTQRDALIRGMKHVRSSGDDDFTPKRIDRALSPESKPLLRQSLILYTELYWDLEHGVSNDYVWRILFKEIVFSKHYPKY